jgi:(2Fe-2S) ferredoxin
MAVKDLIITKKCLFICNGGSCLKKNAEEITQSVRKQLKLFDLDDVYHTVKTKCIGRCDDAPVVLVAPDNIWLKEVTADKCSSILHEIESNKIENSIHYLFKMGESQIKSNSIPTKYRK